MSVWKVLFIAIFGFFCLTLVMATILVPIAVAEHRWLWLAGLGGATLVFGTLFTVYLKALDRTFR